MPAAEGLAQKIAENGPIAIKITKELAWRGLHEHPHDMLRFYAAVTAHRLGLSAGVLTSHGDDFPLEALPPQIEVVTVPAPRTTVFTHHVAAGRRRLTVGAAARPLSAADVPEDWRDAEIVLLFAPVHAVFYLPLTFVPVIIIYAIYWIIRNQLRKRNQI